MILRYIRTNAFVTLTFTIMSGLMAKADKAANEN